MRRLLVIPVLHTAEDLGELGSAVRARKQARLGFQAVRRMERAVAASWGSIEAFVRSLPASLEGYRVYQDGLPVCGRELDIVKEVAARGSRNHALLLELDARGARIMGTEAPELLIEELEAARATLLPRRRPAEGETGSRTLLERRDRAIGERIGKTLLPGETGILFVGALHRVGEYLPGDVVIERPLAGQQG